MNIRNTKNGWGVVAISLHWLVALTVFGLFGLGLYMVELDYYDSWYKTAPSIHKGMGILLFITLLFRVFWRWMSVTPAPLDNHKKWEVALAHWVHRALYLLIFVLMLSGYLISTADGRGIDVFGLFEVPSIINGIDNMEDVAGEVHEILAYILISLVSVHALGALKHHFIDKDRTLSRMLVSKRE